MTAPENAVADWCRHLATDADLDHLLDELAVGTLNRAARATAERLPDKPALRIGTTVISHGELDDRARRLASWLRECGARPGTSVVVAEPNSIAFVVAYLAALHAGAAVTSVAPGLRPREFTDIVGHVGPVASIVAPARRDQLAATDHETSVVTTEGSHGDTIEAVIAGREPLSLQDFGADATAHLAFTSGTTGAPKLTPLSHGNVLASVRAAAHAWRWSERDVLVHGLPLQHAHGLTAVHLSVLTGSSSIVLESFDRNEFCAEARDSSASVIFGVPSAYERLLQVEGFNGIELRSLRLVVSGSAPLAPSTFDKITAALGQPPLERYGLTEAGFVVSNTHDGPRRAGSVGYALPGIELVLRDQAGAPVDDGVDGEITVRGPQVFGGYRSGDDTDEKTGEGSNVTFLPGGWFRTGDLGRRDEETGAVSITGRLKELIVTGGMNVYPREVELVLEAQACVGAAAVVGVPSDRWGEEVTAVIVAVPGTQVDLESIDRAVRDRLAPHKRPKHYHVVADLPRNHMGKLMRATLVEQLGDQITDSSSPS